MISTLDIPMSGKITIVIPTFNRKNLFKLTLDSVKAQTCSEFECIITDNCSTDGCYEIASEYAQIDNRFKVYKNSQNIGPVNNWLAGIKRVKSKWVKILFSDDILDPSFIEVMTNIINNSSQSKNLGAIYTPQSKKSLACSKYFPNILSSELFNVLEFSPFNLSSCSPSAYLLLTNEVKHALNQTIETKDNLRSTGVGYDYFCIYESARGKNVKILKDSLISFSENSLSMSSIASQGKLLNLTKIYSRAYVKIVIQSPNQSILVKLFYLFTIYSTRLYFSLRLK